MLIFKSQQMPCWFRLAAPCVSSGIPDSLGLCGSLFGTGSVYGLGPPWSMLGSVLSGLPQFSCRFEPWAALMGGSAQYAFVRQRQVELGQ